MTTLLATDRCDRCGAQAYAAVVLTAAELMFCGHHWREHGPALLSQGATCRDATPQPTAPRSG